MSLKAIWIVAASILSTVGIIGNSIVFYVSTRTKFRNITIFRYLATSMINDFFIIITIWFYATPDAFKLETETFNCKITVYFGYLFYQYSPYIISIASIDRLLSVKYPTKFKFRTKLKYQILLLLITFSCFVFLDVIYYNYYDIHRKEDNSTYCFTSSPQIHVYIDLVNMVLMVNSFVIMITSTIIVTRYLMSKKAFHQNATSRKEIKCIKVLVAMNSFYIICNLPYCLQRITQDVFNLNNIEFDFHIIEGVSFVLIYVQNTFSFFLYLFCNKVFRGYCLSIVCSKKTI